MRIISIVLLLPTLSPLFASEKYFFTPGISYSGVESTVSEGDFSPNYASGESINLGLRLHVWQDGFSHGLILGFSKIDKGYGINTSQFAIEPAVDQVINLKYSLFRVGYDFRYRPRRSFLSVGMAFAFYFSNLTTVAEENTGYSAEELEPLFENDDAGMITTGTFAIHPFEFSTVEFSIEYHWGWSTVYETLTTDYRNSTWVFSLGYAHTIGLF